MTKILAVCCLVVGFNAFAGEEKEKDKEKGAPAAGGMDMSKMGPGARKPKDEKKAKKEVDEFIKKSDAAYAKGDFDAVVAMNDYPIFMATDDLNGAPEARSYSKEEYVAMMKPMFDGMPKDTKMAHKLQVSVLSDSLVNLVDECTTTTGKVKVTAKNSGLLVKVGGEWKWKSVVEAGWGGMADAKGPAPVAAPPAAGGPPAGGPPAGGPPGKSGATGKK